jgi:hypothetical protein
MKAVVFSASQLLICAAVLMFGVVTTNAFQGPLPVVTTTAGTAMSRSGSSSRSKTALNVFGTKKKNKSPQEIEAEAKFWQGEWVCKDCGYIYNRVRCVPLLGRRLVLFLSVPYFFNEIDFIRVLEFDLVYSPAGGSLWWCRCCWVSVCRLFTTVSAHSTCQSLTFFLLTLLFFFFEYSPTRAFALSLSLTSSPRPNVLACTLKSKVLDSDAPSALGRAVGMRKRWEIVWGPPSMVAMPPSFSLALAA